MSQKPFEANHTQRRELVKMFLTHLMSDPMYKKMGSHTTPILQNAVRFQIENLPLNPRKIVKKLELAGVDDEDETEFYVFSLTLEHPCLDYKTTITHEMPVESFKVLV